MDSKAIIMGQQWSIMTLHKVERYIEKTIEFLKKTPAHR